MNNQYVTNTPVSNNTPQAINRESAHYLRWLLMIISLMMLIWFGATQLIVRKISVVGSAKVNVKAEKAKVIIAYANQQPSYDLAESIGKQEYSNIMNQINSIGVSSVKEVMGRVVKSSSDNYQYITGAEFELNDMQKVVVVSNIISNTQAEIVNIIYYPSDSKKIENDLYQLAIKEAEESAKSIALASRGRVGQVLNVVPSNVETVVGSTVRAIGADTSEGVFDVIEMKKELAVTFRLKTWWVLW